MRGLTARQAATRGISSLAVAALAIGVLPSLGSGVAGAQGGTISYTKATASNKVAETDVNGGQKIVSVWSDAMGAEIPSIVQPPANGNRNAPVLYLLNGAGGGEDSATWQAQSDVTRFMGDKNMWTVTPIGGRGTYYTDWQNYDPNVGTNIVKKTNKPLKLETFMTWELPFQFENHFGGSVDENRKRGIAAISMTGTSVLNYAEHAPGRFQFVGAYSGCAETATPIGHAAVQVVTQFTGGPNLDNMWGPFPGQGWTDNDPVAGAWKLKDKTPVMYITSGNGLPGPHETLDNPRIDGNVGVLANQAIVGGVLEAATNYCTANLGRRFNELGIPGDKAHFNYRPNGTHSWGYWQDDLHDSWPHMAFALGV
ncbi:alpha/beta hydrolase [Dietzia sp.]|uniref:alpha/beta hydrolase n=1 Tax=Dietzia sp. TaxID=1871616 RepID=UPI002FDAE203